MQKPFSAPPAKRAKGTPSDLIVAADAKIAEARKARKSGKLAPAIAICKALVNDYPTYVAALHMLGDLEMHRKNHWVSLPLLVQAAMLNPRDGEVLASLARNYLKLGASELAARTLEQATKLQGEKPGALYTLGQILMEENEYERAAETFAKALKLDPALVGAAYGLGQCHSHLGRVEEAAAAFKRALKLAPGSPHLLYVLGQLPASLVDIDLVAAVEVARQTNTDKDENSSIYLGLAKAAGWHALGRHKEAWDDLVAANRAADAMYAANREADAGNLRRSRERAAKMRGFKMEKTAASAELPMTLFILGPSRSGKTSLERLVATVDGVKCGHESQIPQNSARRAFQFAGLPTIERLADLPRRLHKDFLRLYAAELGERAPDARLFASTNPGTIHDVGPIAQAVPKSRFVFINRNRHDLVFRIYGKKYHRNKNRYAYNIDRIFHYLDWYEEMAEIWSKLLPDRTMTVDYEDMIADPAATLARVAQFCGLPMPAAPLPPLGDDRGCAAPYRAFIDAARGSNA